MRRMFVVGGFALSLCSFAGGAEPAKVTFDDHILPFFRDKCLSCHNPDKKSSGLVLNNYSKVMEGGSSGAVVKPGETTDVGDVVLSRRR